MNLPLFISFRYLFSKKKHNAINIISMICAGGICVATLSLVCTLSVYNGFQQLITDLYNSFDPDLKITLRESKTFDVNNPDIQRIKMLDFVSAAAETLEENVLVKSQEKQSVATVKGVAPDYLRLISPEMVMYSGDFILSESGADYAVIGAALANRLETGVNFVTPISLYAPKQGVKVNLTNPERAFNEKQLFVIGIYSVNQQEIDNKFIFVPITFAQELFGYGQKATAIELKIKDGVNINSAKREIEKLLGSNYLIQDKQELHEEFYRMLKIEKWITFLILAFILLIAVINVIGSLTMLIIEKKDDMQTLRNLGATSRLIRSIFLFEGWFVSLLGALAGLVIGLILCLLQQFFGLIRLNDGGLEGAFIVDAYPVSVAWTDIGLIMLTVLTVGFIVAWYPVRQLK